MKLLDIYFNCFEDAWILWINFISADSASHDNDNETRFSHKMVLSGMFCKYMGTKFLFKYE